MSSVYTQIHKKFDDELLILKQLKRNPKDSEKLQFNISRTELTHLLLKLKDGDIISKDISDYALAVFSENNFLCVRDNTPRVPMKGIQKYIAKIRSGEQLSVAAIESLKERLRSILDTLLKANINIK